MATKRDFYDVLGVPKNADKDRIKAAYRELAKKYHPDINKEPGAEEKFKEIKEAYDVLYDDEKRANYDQFGHDAFDQQDGGGFSSQQTSYGFGFDDIGDIFSSFFGGGDNRNRTSKKRGSDTEMTIKISFMDAILGKKITLNVTYDESCSNCHGIGGEFDTCSKCGGKGFINKQGRSSFLGIVQTQIPCSKCGGNGKIIVNTCSRCNGKGFYRTKKILDVKIPAGINNKQQIRLQGKGNHGYYGGENGDLYIEVIVEPHKFFKREGNDIHVTIPLNFIDIILGTEVEVPTVYGNTILKIPNGTQPTQIFKLKGKGVKDIHSIFSYGNEYVHLDIKVPTHLSKKQISLLNEFKKEMK